MNQAWDEGIPQINGTYQNFVSCPGYFTCHGPSGQSKLCPQFLNESITAPHLEHIHQTGHLGQHWQLRVDHSSLVSDQVLGEWVLLIPHNQRTLQNALPLPLQLIFFQGISVKIQDAPPRCFKAQTLVARKVTTPLVMPQHFMVPMGQDGHVLSAQATVEVAGHIRSIRRPSHKKPPYLCGRVNLLHSECLLAPNPPAPLTCISFVTAGIWRLDPLRTTLRGSLLESVQYFIQLYQTEKRTWWPAKGNNNTKFKRRRILTIHQRRQPLSFLLLADGATQRHQLMTRGMDHSGSGIGHKLVCNTNKMVKTWSQLRTILVNSSFEAQELPSSNARSSSSLLRFRLWTASGTSCWGPPAKGTRLLVTTMWRPLNCPSVSTPVDTSSVPDIAGIVSASPGNKTGNEPLIWKPAM